MRKLYLLILLCASTFLLQAQTWIHYDTSNSGLLANSIYTIAIDAQDNKWFGAKGYGINKFDDTNWTAYTMSNSNLAGNSVSSIAIDSTGVKWFGLETVGIAKLDGNNWTTYTPSNSGFSYPHVISLAIETHDTIWIATSFGLYKYGWYNWTNYTNANTNNGLPDNDISGIAIDAQGNKWLATNGGIAKFDGVNWTKYTTANSGVPNNNPERVAVDTHGNKWFTFGNKLIKFDGLNWVTYNAPFTGSTYCLMIDAQDNKWITSFKGLFRFDGSNWHSYTTLNSPLVTNNILSVAQDLQGNIWVGTFKEGVYKLIDWNTGIDNVQKDAKDILIYPNPSEDFIYFSSNEREEGTLSLRDMNDKLIYTTNLHQERTKTLEIRNLPRGAYLVCFKNGEREITKKVIKQ